MLGWRLLISAFLIPLLIFVFVLDHRAGASAPYLLGLAVLCAIRGSYEYSDLMRTRLFEPSFPLIAGCSSAVIGAVWWGRTTGLDPGPLGTALVVFAISTLLIFLRGEIRYREPGRSLETIGAEVLGVAYLGVLMAVTAQLRWVAGSQAGYLVLASLVIAAKCGDIGAYTLGRLFGKRKMVPRLSPGKTWMGGLGALLGSGLATWAWLHFGPQLFFENAAPCPAGWSILYGLLIGVAGVVGDLAESLIKRDVGRKDAAQLMPGFGGLLDLLDSVLYTGPLAWVLWKLLPLATWPVTGE